MRRFALLVLIAAAAIAGPAAAEPMDWTVDFGGAARVRPDHMGATHYRVDAVPIVEANYGDKLIISFDDGAKFRAFTWGPVSAGPIAEYRQSFNDALPRGAFRMSDVVELGGFVEGRTPVGIAEARLRHAVGGYDGWSGDLSFSTGASVTPKLMIGGQARLSWADSNFTQEYFGLRPHAASRFGLPRFLGQDFVTAGGELDVARQLTPKVRLVLAVSEDRIIGELRPSPVFDSRDIFTTTLGLTYHWSSGTAGRPQ